MLSMTFLGKPVRQKTKQTQVINDFEVQESYGGFTSEILKTAFIFMASFGFIFVL